MNLVDWHEVPIHRISKHANKQVAKLIAIPTKMGLSGTFAKSRDLLVTIELMSMAKPIRSALLAGGGNDVQTKVSFRILGTNFSNKPDLLLRHACPDIVERPAVCILAFVLIIRSKTDISGIIHTLEQYSQLKNAKKKNFIIASKLENPKNGILVTKERRNRRHSGCILPQID